MPPKANILVCKSRANTGSGASEAKPNAQQRIINNRFRVKFLSIKELRKSRPLKHMTVTVQVPDELALRINAAGGDIARRVLEALALQEFKNRF
jgi:hypothetical protein